MASSTVLPALGKSTGKPTRSMTYPLREARPQGSKRRVKQGEPFDPEDLSRRLNAHIAEQKARAELRRKAREAKASTDARLYHHVPTVAASAFERTMTPESMRSVPKIALPAIKAHRDAIKANDLGMPHATALKETQARDKERLERQLLSSRNQFQWNQEMENANEADMERNLFKLPQRTFTEFAYLKGKMQKTTIPRPISTGGEVLWEEDAVVTSPKPRSKPVLDRNDRNDWTQRDDDVRNEKATPLLRKRDSNWILLGMKSLKHDRGIENVSPPDPANTTKMRGSFLARFKRHPS